MNNSFLKRTQNFIFQEKLLNQGDKVVIGISGGPDSVGLSLALRKLQVKYNLELFLVHINYHQRDKDSDDDQKFVEKFAKKNQLDLKVFDYLEKPESGLEEIFRDFRYEKFEEVRRELNFDKIAVAHIKDEQMETFLMNLLRGAGLQGLKGMSAKNNFIIRPFLKFNKKEIETFLKLNNQKFRLDKTNLKPDFTRNKIRLELIPLLEDNFNLKIKDGISKLVENLRDEMDFNQFAIDEIYNDLVEEKSNELCLNILKFRKIPVGGQKGIFRKIILELKGDLKNITSNNFLEFKKILESSKNKKQQMKIGKIALEKSDECVIFKSSN